MIRLLRTSLHLLLLTGLFGQALAQETFEEAGTVDSIDKVAQTITVDGQRMLVSGNVQSTYDNRTDHLLNIIAVGSTIGVTGVKQHGGVLVIKDAVIYELPSTNSQQEN